MTRFRFTTLSVAAIGILLSVGGCTSMNKEQGMTVHRVTVTSEMSDRDAAAAYRAEAAVLQENARTHRNMAQHYKALAGGKMDFSQVVRHCEKLAQQYKEAAKEAAAISSELSK